MIATLFSDLGAACADLFWPPGCAGCDVRLSSIADGDFCEDCAATLRPIEKEQSCARCAAPLSAAPKTHAAGCADCRRLPSLISRILAPFEYGGALADALLRLKWQGRDDLATPLGRLLAPSLAACAPQFDLLVPVPLHPRRLRERGYNQATQLARAARRAAKLGATPPLAVTVLRRQRSDPPTRGLGVAERRARTLTAFAVRRPATVVNKRVLLIDDVVTTGATVLACATALRAAGAAHVEALALLRAPLT